jgi:sensor histidine kinase regulating citrate/malate metabolism
MKNNQKGFGAVEEMLLIIIVLLVGFIGYYVYHTKNNTNSTYNATAKTINSTPNVQQAANKSTDEAAIIAAVKAKNPNTTNLQVTVTNYEGQFAKGTAHSDEPSGFAFVAKKESGSWSVIFAGQELPSKADGQKYDMPTGWYSTDY